MPHTPDPLRIGLISDTHGLLRSEALAFLRGCDHILHAGDIGAPEILHALTALAPTSAVRGNNDHGDWAEALPALRRLQFGDVTVLLLHDIAELPPSAAADGVQVVVSGHSHRPAVQQRDGLLFVNPGSAGRRRFSLPIACGELHIAGAQVTPRIVPLPVPAPAAAGR